MGSACWSLVEIYAETGLENKLVSTFKWTVDVIGSGIWEFMNEMNEPALLKRNLVGFSVGWCQ